MRISAWFVACSSFGAFACAIPGVNTGSDAGPSDGGASSSSDGGNAAAVGSNCAQVAAGLALCTGISVCGTTIAVDHDVYPDCGFRIKGTVLDLECVCNGDSVCPIGVATDCASAYQLLQNQTQQTVCQQVAEGRCTSTTPGGTTGGTSSSTCDKTCESECAGNPTCIQQCGC